MTNKIYLWCVGPAPTFIQQSVGSSVTLSKRMAAHFFHGNSNKDTRVVLYRAMRKYKLENFSLAILEFSASDIITCSDLEQK